MKKGKKKSTLYPWLGMTLIFEIGENVNDPDEKPGEKIIELKKYKGKWRKYFEPGDTSKCTYYPENSNEIKRNKDR